MTVGTMGINIPGISNIVDSVKEVLSYVAAFGNILWTSIAFVLSMLIYGVQQGFFLIIDCVNSLFRSIAGLDVYYVNGIETEGDIVYSLLQNPVVTSVFTSVLVASIFLLFVTTFIAIFKTEFDLSKSNAKGPIIGRAIKSVLYFACVPIICILGVYISNVFLRTFDAATSQGASSMSGQVFAAAAYDGNRARHDSQFANMIKNSGVVPGITASSTQAEVAQAIDDAFRVNAKAKGIAADDDDSTKIIWVEGDWRGHMQGWVVTEAGIWGSRGIEFNHFSINNTLLVYYYYDLLSGYNYLIGFMSSFMVTLLLLTLIVGVIQRIFELVILFVISPAFVATMPLDEGARFGKWKDAFVKRTMSAYGPVVGINLLFMVLTFTQDIDVFDPNMFMGGFFNALVQCLFIIVGLLAVKDFSGMISELVGSNDALSQGEQKKGDVAKLGGKVATAGAIGLRAGAKTAAWAGRKAWNPFYNAKVDKHNKNAKQHNAKVNAAEKQAIEKVKANWGLTDKEAKARFEGWKNGKLTGAEKAGMDFLVKNNADLFDTAKQDRIKGKKKKDVKLDLWDEFDAIDDTITGAWRAKLKDANKDHTNPLYALMGEELKKTRYSSRHKRRADNDKVKDIREDEEKKLAASMIIQAKKAEGDLGTINIKEYGDIRLKLELERDRLHAAGNTFEASVIDSQLANFDRLKGVIEKQKTDIASELSAVSKLKNIKPESLNQVERDIMKASSEIGASVADWKNLKTDIEKAIARAKSIP